ncbi:MAG TPA: hypothetical protein PL157_15265, partial [Acidobacteriota bacterium]|nr:hypothetical protein [Acidobacteriota bacterium]
LSWLERLVVAQEVVGSRPINRPTWNLDQGYAHTAAWPFSFLEDPFLLKSSIHSTHMLARNFSNVGCLYDGFFPGCPIWSG